MKKLKLTALLSAAAMTVSMMSAVSVSAAQKELYYEEDFEDYNVGENYAETRALIQEDPDNSANKTAFFDTNGGSINVDLKEAVSGNVEINAKFRAHKKDSCRSNYALTVKGDSGNIAVLRLGILSKGTSINGAVMGQWDVYSRWYAMLTPASGEKDGDTTAKDTSTVYRLNSDDGDIWSYVRMIIHTDKKTCDVYIARSEINDEMIESEAGFAGYCKDIPFYTLDSNAVTGITVQANWIDGKYKKNVYVDDLSILADVPDKPQATVEAVDGGTTLDGVTTKVFSITAAPNGASKMTVSDNGVNSATVELPSVDSEVKFGLIMVGAEDTEFPGADQINVSFE